MLCKQGVRGSNPLTSTNQFKILGNAAGVRAWLLRRKLPRVNCGRAVRIPADAVTQFIERNTAPAREERR